MAPCLFYVQDENESVVPADPGIKSGPWPNVIDEQFVSLYFFAVNVVLELSKINLIECEESADPKPSEHDPSNEKNTAAIPP